MFVACGGFEPGLFENLEEMLENQDGLRPRAAIGDVGRDVDSGVFSVLVLAVGMGIGEPVRGLPVGERSAGGAGCD